MVGQGCVDRWAMPRNSHLGAMVIVRRQGFSNEQWNIAGTNLLQLRYTEPGPFASDPSEIVRPANCREPRPWGIVNNQVRGDWSIHDALNHLPRDAFDYLWLIDVPPFDPRLIEGMELIWTGPGSSLFRIRPGDEGPPRARPRTASAVAR